MNVQKGTIATIDQDAHLCRVVTISGLKTCDLVIPWFLRKEAGNLQVGTEVVFVMFEDNTGQIISRMDGDWEYKTIKSLEVHGDFAVKKNENSEDDGKLGKITATDKAIIDKDILSHEDVKTDEITLNTHVHTYLKPSYGSNSDTSAGH